MKTFEFSVIASGLDPEAESVAVPFVTIGNRQALTYEQLFEHQWLMDFVRNFPTCFELHGGGIAAFIFWPEGDSPHPVRIRWPAAGQRGPAWLTCPPLT
jgi:hypothetical protein